MARRQRRRPVPQQPVTADITALSHDGRGIARIDGKTTFIDNALPGEQVQFRYTAVHSKFDEGRAEEILRASPERAEPPCEHALLCGGCSLQHMHSDAQVALKQSVLAEQLDHFGGLTPERWLPPLRGPVVGYRGKARLGVRYVIPRETAFVGFREKRNNFLADIRRCAVLTPAIGESLLALRELVTGLEARARLPQIEIATGDDDIALVFRHMDPLSADDLAAIVAFCQARGWHCYLQPGNESTVHRVWPMEGEERLYYRLPSGRLPSGRLPSERLPSEPLPTGHQPADEVELAFHPIDFTQVNAAINREMVPLALELLDIRPEHRVLDLFCGLGNFTLPMARHARQVVGVELSEAMVARGEENARRNGLSNLSFHAWDLSQDVSGQSWAAEQFDRVLIDPPRAGALEMVRLMPQFGAQKLVYVSCNPATLARDAGELKALGYRLRAAGVMDMFPHTTHVESIALFERG